MSEQKEIPQINIENNPKWSDWETSSIGSSGDLANETNALVNRQNATLGWNLPTNDTSKAGNLDTLSVDSYWVGEDELEEIEKEKQNDPINPNYRAVYEKIQMKLNLADQKEDIPTKEDVALEETSELPDQRK